MAKRTIFKQLRSKTFDVFDFNRSEQRGLFVLIIVLSLLIGFRIALSYVHTSGVLSEDNNEAIEQFLAMQQQYHDSVLAARKNRNFYTGGQYERKEYSARRQLTPFLFDPNMMTFSDWKQLGFTEKEAQQIVNYQSKGGRFYQKSDLKKLYCVNEEDYQVLEPYIELSFKEKAEQKWENKKILPSTKLDINSLDSIELQKIPGIGLKTASRIVQYRKKLRGFAHIHQLKEIYTIDSNRFSQIEPYLYADNSKIKKININQAEIKELVQHPYIDYSVAKSIVVYRQNQGNYNKVEDIKKAIHFYDELYQKIIPYLDVK